MFCPFINLFLIIYIYCFHISQFYTILLLFIFDLYYHQNICRIYFSIHLEHASYPNPFLNFWLKMYGSSKAKKGNHRHWILSGNEKRERLGFCSIQKVILTNEQTLDFLYRPALGTLDFFFLVECIHCHFFFINFSSFLF